VQAARPTATLALGSGHAVAQRVAQRRDAFQLRHLKLDGSCAPAAFHPGKGTYRIRGKPGSDPVQPAGGSH
jgi:hypothetical protein